MPKRPSVMVFEDDLLLAEALVDVLLKLGCRVTASAANFDQAMLMASTEDCDLAIVDIDLRGVLAYPVLDRLQDRGISFLMATGTPGPRSRSGMRMRRGWTSPTTCISWIGPRVRFASRVPRRRTSPRSDRPTLVRLPPSRHARCLQPSRHGAGH